ncbi:MAG: hypothetical protein R2942_15405 [Ignavibacteria bacterium]
MQEYDDEKVYEEFLQYDGIGVKTISCVLIFAMGQLNIISGGYARAQSSEPAKKNLNTNSPVENFEEIKDKIPEDKKYELHSNLIKFGRNFCRSNNPLCSKCFLYSLCKYEFKNENRKLKPPVKVTENNFIILENL